MHLSSSKFVGIFWHFVLFDFWYDSLLEQAKYTILPIFFFWTKQLSRWYQKKALTPSLLEFLAHDDLGRDSPFWSASVVSQYFVMHSGCREDPRSRPLVPSFHLLWGRVKGKATGMMKRCYPTLIVFRGACMCSHFSLTLSAGGNYN